VFHTCIGKVNLVRLFITDTAMQSNLINLTAVAVFVASGLAYAQSSGTGFVVAPGLLVTNHHVIDDCAAIEVVASDGLRPATIVDSVQIIDLALLRVYGLRGGVASLRTQSPVLLGESATVFGFPLGGALSSTGNFTTGVVSSLRGLRDAAGEIQITAPVQPGNSGGPVIDRAGLVIGVVQSKLDALRVVKATGDIPQNVNFAVSLDVLADFLAKNNVPIKAAARGVAIETTQVAEMAQSFTHQINCKAAIKTATKPKQQEPVPSHKPAPLPDKLVQDIQIALNQKGFNAGPADGVIGPRTTAAIATVQRTLNLIVNGIPSNTLLIAIKNMPTVGGGSTVQSGVALTNLVPPILSKNEREEQSAFDGAMDQYRKGKFKASAESLAAFLRRYPDSVLAPTAHFYLGGSFYALKQYSQTIAILKTMAGKYPQHPRAPDALLLVAGSQFELKDKGAAKATLQRIHKDYKGTIPAQRAEELLNQF
jgi:tol-pal system protein YbgF